MRDWQEARGDCKSTRRVRCGDEPDRLLSLSCGDDLIAPLLLSFGAQESRDAFLPGIRSGEEWWCEALSDSTLGKAGFREALGGGFVLGGLVRGVTHADFMDYILLAARELGADGDPRSLFAVPLDAPGVRLRQIGTGLTDDPLFEIWVSEVALESRHLIGPMGAADELIDFCLSVPHRNFAGIAELRRTASKLFEQVRESTSPHPGEEPRDLEIGCAELEIELLGLEVRAERLARSTYGEDRFSIRLLRLELEALQQRLGELALGVIAYGAFSSGVQADRPFGSNLPVVQEGDPLGAIQIYFHSVGGASTLVGSVRNLDLAAMEILEGYDD